MDQDTIRVSEKEQLTAPPGWTKKLVPASAKSVTLRKYDVVFIAPDGQEMKSKWHLTRYLKAHPEGPAISEFNWNSGEEAPIRRSTRFATKEVSEDNKSKSRKKGKRDAAEMEVDQEKAPSRKRAKKAGKSEGSKEEHAVEVPADVLEKDEVMHEVIACNTEATLDAVSCEEAQKNESKDANLVEGVIEEAMDKGLDKEAKAEGSSATVGEQQEDIQAIDVIEEAMDEGLDKEAKAEGSSATVGEQQEDIQAKDVGLDKQAEEEKTIVSSANIEEGLEESKVKVVEVMEEEIQVKVVEVMKPLTDNGLHAAAQETDTLVASAEEVKVEEVAMETEVIEPKNPLDQKLEENKDVSCNITVVTSSVEGFADDDDKALEPMMQKEEPSELLIQKEDSMGPLMQKEEPSDSMEPLMQKEEQERLTQIQNSPLKVEQIKDESPSEFSSSLYL